MSPSDLKIVHEPLIEFVKPDGPPEQKKVLVIGSPKSGSTYMAWFLRELGLRVEHERMGLDGTVNAAWLMPKIVDDPFLIDERARQHFIFDRVIHLVRHPLEVLASLQALPPWPFLKWQYLWTGVRFPAGEAPNLLYLGQFWIWWTDRCTSAADFTIRLDDIARVGPPRNVTVKPVEEIEWDDITDHVIKRDMQHRASKYGWEVPF